MRLGPALVLSLLLTTACAGESAAPTPTPTTQGVEVFTDLGHDHKKGRLKYAQTPPVGGDHNASWLACGTYTEPVPNETAVHSMEHGAIWITYRPDLPVAQVATLADVQKINTEYVLVSPYPDLPAPIVVSTWGLQLKVETAGDPRIVPFVQTYAGGDQGNEKGVPCKGGGLSLEKAKEAVG